MMNTTLKQYNETDPLKKVIVGRCKEYKQNAAYVERVNASQEQGLPSREKLIREFDQFERCLTAHGVVVVKPDYVGKFVYDQLTPRDLGVTIADKFVLCHMAKSSRRYEAAGIFRHLLKMNGEEPNILIPSNSNMLIEGGDIIVDKGFIFAGLTNRTNAAGIKFLMDAFEPRLKVIPLHCETYSSIEYILHLDCVFNPVGEEHALIYQPGLKHIPRAITENYQLIHVNKSAQQALATNVLSINQEVVISRDHPGCRGVNKAMESAGIKVIPLPFDAAPSTGGSFRCCSLPLVRG